MPDVQTLVTVLAFSNTFKRISGGGLCVLSSSIVASSPFTAVAGVSVAAAFNEACIEAPVIIFINGHEKLSLYHFINTRKSERK